MGKTCQAEDIGMDYCDKTELQTSHHGTTRPQIIERLLQDFRIRPDYYEVDLDVLESRFREYHKQDKVVHFLCDKCHRTYEKSLKHQIKEAASRELIAAQIKDGNKSAFSNKGKAGWVFNIPLKNTTSPYTLVLKENDKIVKTIDVKFKHEKFKGLKIRDDRNAYVFTLINENGKYIDKVSKIKFI